MQSSRSWNGLAPSEAEGEKGDHRAAATDGTSERTRGGFAPEHEMRA